MSSSTFHRETRQDNFRTYWQRWHAERDAALRAPDGWLSVTALHWLVDAWQELDDVPGTWRVDGDTVLLDASPADGVRTGEGGRGDTVDGTVTLVPVEGAPGVAVRHGVRILDVIRRTGSFAIRVHDPAAVARAPLATIPTYDPDPGWVLEARFTPFDAERTVTTGAVVDGLEHHHRAVGALHFRFGDDDHRLIAFDAGDGLRVLFTDATSGHTTYPSARVLSVPAPDAQGRTVLDFTRAANLPCAFTPFATCPVAPSENRLPFAVQAGEQDPARDGRAR